MLEVLAALLTSQVNLMFDKTFSEARLLPQDNYCRKLFFEMNLMIGVEFSNPCG